MLFEAWQAQSSFAFSIFKKGAKSHTDLEDFEFWGYILSLSVIFKCPNTYFWGHCI